MAAHFIGVPAVRGGGLIGRDDDLAAALDLLTNQDEDVALLGLGGSGKSSLAAALVTTDAVRDCFTGGVLWLGVGHDGLEGSAGAQLAEWAEALGTRCRRVVTTRLRQLRDQTGVVTPPASAERLADAVETARIGLGDRYDPLEADSYTAAGPAHGGLETAASKLVGEVDVAATVARVVAGHTR